MIAGALSDQMPSDRLPSRARSGLTLLELVLSVALLSLLMTGVLQLFDTSMTLLEQTETRRDLVEMGSSVVELLGEDLADAHGGARGDLLVDWVTLDVDGDGIAAAAWPRVRVVRPASAAERQRLWAAAESSRGPASDGDARTLSNAGDGSALIEVCWALLPPAGLPTSDPRRPLGVLWRGERIRAGGSSSESFFAPDFFDARGRPQPGALNEVTGGVLWLQVLAATQTSILHDGWLPGTRLEHAATSWDAWTRGRPDADLHRWNESAAGAGEATGVPILPRRVRIELEVERPRDVKRRPLLVEAVEREAGTFRVSDATRMPDVGSFLLLGEEWVELRALDGRLATVHRGARGTRPARHPARTVMHFGARAVREVPIVLAREDWDL